MTEQRATLTPMGNSYQVDVLPLDAHFVFRDVQTGSEPKGDVTVRHGDKHLFRTPSTLSLAGRDKIAKTAAELDSGDGPAWRLAVFAAVEKVMEAEEQAGGFADLRYADEAGADDAMIVGHLFPDAATIVVAPNGAGKSSLLRGMALSIASGWDVIPGQRPNVKGPVLYVAGEDAVTRYHARHIGALCRGLNQPRSAVEYSIELMATNGRPLAKIARRVAERAADCAAVMLDSYGALVAPGGPNSYGPDAAAAYWNAVDQIAKPSFAVFHPNRADRKAWNEAEGSPSGFDINSDRMRCAWKLLWREDDDEMMKIKRRRYTLRNTKWSHGEELADVSFAIEHWRGGHGDEYARFSSSYTITDDAPRIGRPPVVADETLRAYQNGATTPKQLASVLGIEENTAKQRLRRLRLSGQLGAESGGTEVDVPQ